MQKKVQYMIRFGDDAHYTTVLECKGADVFIPKEGDRLEIMCPGSMRRGSAKEVQHIVWTDSLEVRVFTNINVKEKYRPKV